VYPEVVGVMCNTRIEYPEIMRHVRSQNNICVIRPEKRFREVIEKYGYPVVSKEQSQYISECRSTKSEKLRNKRLNGVLGKPLQGKISDKWKFLLDAPFKISPKCCYWLKKRPMDKYVKKTGLQPIVGTKASDSWMREMDYLKDGCNTNSSRPTSRPLSFWLDSDIWEYVGRNGLKTCSIYKQGYSSTGCIFCCFGAHREEGTNRFQRLGMSHPKLWEYCMDTLGMREVLTYMNISHEPCQQLQFDMPSHPADPLSS